MSASNFKDAELAEALAECERLSEENRQLRGRLELPVPEVAAPPAVVPGPVSAESSPEEKMRFFLSLFCGCEDVYAMRWEGRNGKAGFSPACRRIWGKPSRKHSEEPSEDFPLTDRVINDHLVGKLMAGVYPLLVDETCFFLAADFDKATWQ